MTLSSQVRGAQKDVTVLIALPDEPDPRAARERRHQHALERVTAAHAAPGASPDALERLRSDALLAEQLVVGLRTDETLLAEANEGGATLLAPAGNVGAAVPASIGTASLRQAVERHWEYHALSRSLRWDVSEGAGGGRIEVAPVLQEIVGGGQDGMEVWSGFGFDLSGFLAERGVVLGNLAAASRCSQCAETPHVGVRGTYFGRPFDLRIHLEPVPGTPPAEVVDTINQQVRDIQGTQP